MMRLCNDAMTASKNVDIDHLRLWDVDFSMKCLMAVKNDKMDWTTPRTSTSNAKSYSAHCHGLLAEFLRRSIQTASSKSWDCKFTHLSVTDCVNEERYMIPVNKLSKEDKAFVAVCPYRLHSEWETTPQYILYAWVTSRFEQWADAGFQLKPNSVTALEGGVVEILDILVH